MGHRGGNVVVQELRPGAVDHYGLELRRRLALPRISVVIPTLNEAANLPHVLERIPQYVHEVILVDGHSTDCTVNVALSIRPDIKVVYQTGRGKGNALACGFDAVTGNIVVMLDADGSTDPKEIPIFIDRLRGGADLVKGSRFLSRGGSEDLTAIRNFGNRALNGLVNALYRTDYTDLCYGYNAFWSRHLPVLQPDSDGFEVETLMNIRAAKAGLAVAEVPSFERNRIHGESKLNARRDGTRVLKTIVTELFTETEEPAKIEVPKVWDGVERRSGRDRRYSGDRRTAPTPGERRRSPGRRWVDLISAQGDWPSIEAGAR